MGDSQIMCRLQSPLPHGSAGVVPGLPTIVPISPVPISEKRDCLVEPNLPRIVRTDVPLGKQGWTNDSPSRPILDQEPGSPVRDVQAGLSAPAETSLSEEAAAPRPALRGSRKPQEAYHPREVLVELFPTLSSRSVNLLHMIRPRN